MIKTTKPLVDWVIDSRGSNKKTTHSQSNHSRFSAIRQLLKQVLVWLACSEMIPAAIVVYLLGGLKND